MRVDYLLFVYPNKKVYKISPLLIKNYCEKYNLIRKQDRVNNYLVPYTQDNIKEQEVTYSFPINLMERFV